MEETSKVEAIMIDAIDVLEVMEYIQLYELREAGLPLEHPWLNRLEYLSSIYNEEDIASYSLRASRKMFGESQRLRIVAND